MIRALHVACNWVDPDEPMHLHFSWQISQGLKPYRDFFTLRNMLLHTLWAPVMGLMRDNLQVVLLARLVFLGLLLATLGVLAKVASQVKGDRAALAILLLSQSPFVWGSIEFRADPPANLLALGGLWLMLRGSPGAAGGLLGAAFLMGQKASVHGFAVGLGGLLGGQRISKLVRLTAVAGLVGGLHFLAAWCLGILDDYIRCAYGYSQGFVTGYASGHLNPFVAAFLNTVKEYPLLALFGLVGLGTALGRGATPAQRQLGVTAVATTAMSCLMRVGFKNWTLFTVSCLTLVAAVGFARLTAAPRPGLAAVVRPVVLLLTASLSLLYWAASPPPGLEQGDARLALAAVAPWETYHGEDNLGHLANPIFRHNASYFGNAQSALDPGIRRADPGRDYYPMDFRPLLEKPPRAFCLQDPRRVKALLEALRERGYVYERRGRALWVLTAEKHKIFR